MLMEVSSAAVVSPPTSLSPVSLASSENPRYRSSTLSASQIGLSETLTRP